jgi:serine/threonine protein kinase
MSGDRPRSEGEMSARFSELKEAGSGTFFADVITVDNQAPISIGLAQGAIIGGVYKIIRFVGSGAMGEVYLAKHLTLDKDCALKVIPPEQVTEMAGSASSLRLGVWLSSIM